MITKLNEFNKEEVNDFYNSINKNPTKNTRPYRVAWNNQHNQETRYQLLLDAGVTNGDTILDFGCGLGDLYGYTKKINLNVNYIGVDINENYIMEAKDFYKDAKFYVIDTVNDIKESFDWFLASGSFTMSFTFDEILKILIKVYNKSNKGVAFNMLKDRSIDAFKQKRNFYGAYFYNPDFVIKELRKYFFDDVEMIEDYLDMDFTIHLKK